MSIVTVYNKETGQKAIVSGPDSKEYIESGGWQMEPVDVKGSVPVEKIPDLNKQVMVPVEMIGKADGSPFASEAAATSALTKQGLSSVTHRVTPVEGGFAIVPVA